MEPIVDQSIDVRAAWLRNNWLPFVQHLNALLHQCKERARLAYAKEERMPSQRELSSIVARCSSLSEQWYGRPCLSIVFAFLVELASSSCTEGFSWSSIPTWRSNDGFVRVLDGNTRSTVIAETTKQLAQETTRVVLPSGESTIDDCAVPNVMLPEAARQLLCGDIIKRVLVRLVQAQQRVILRKIGASLGVDLLAAEEQGGPMIERLRTLRHHLQQWIDAGQPTTGATAADGSVPLLASLKINVDSGSFDALVRFGRVLSSWGQLRSIDQQRVHELVRSELAAHYQPREQAGNATPKSEHLIHEFLAVVRRSTLERLTIFRYIAYRWQRQVPLLTVREDRQIHEVRAAQQVEYARFRRNCFPYNDGHGLGISGGGVLEELHERDSLLFELSVAYPLDPGAKLPNWFLIDIEKILFEAWLLNPPRLPGDTLPGEIFHEVSQNPKYSSSIELTQHTQISWGTTADWPLTQFECAPRWIDELQAYIDVVQIGTNEDACSVRCKTRAPLHAPLVSMLQGMRLACQQQLGGTKVDFVLMAQTSPDGWFVVQFFPTVNLHHEGDAITNADLGLDWKLANLPYRAINSASAKGAMMINVRAYQEQALQGYPILVRLFDFNRKPGVRAIIREYLSQYGYDDTGNSQVGPSSLPDPERPLVYSAMRDHYCKQRSFSEVLAEAEIECLNASIVTSTSSST